MPEEVKLNKSRGIIEVDSFGKVTKDDSMASLETIKSLLKDSDAKAILVDTRRQAVSTPRLENISGFAAQLPQGVKIALVYQKNHANEGAYTFMTASAISSSVNMRMYDSRDDAVAWLSG